MKQTPLYSVYSNYPEVRIIDFGGWELPVHFSSGITAEHLAVREAAGLFDVSHMGEILIEGPESTGFLDYLVTNDVRSLEDGQVLYTPMCYPHGGCVDDLIIYRYHEHSYLVVVNAANIEKDHLWMTQENPYVMDRLGEMPSIINTSDSFVQIALQGPKAEDILAQLVPTCREISFFRFQDALMIDSIPVLISRTGYTGEDGFEIYCDALSGPRLWERLLTAGEPQGLIPCGLGARDSLRLESKLPLYGHELSEDITPLEANLKAFVAFTEHDFCGKDALLQQQRDGIPRSLRGIRMIDRGVPRNGYEVYAGERCIGQVTSGTKSPVLGSFVGLVLIRRGIGLSLGDSVEIDIRGKRKKAELVRTPFIKHTGRKR